MRRLSALLMIAVLLCGCTALGPWAPSPIPGGEAVGLYGNLWYLPNEAVEGMEVADLQGTRDGLLVLGTSEQTQLLLLSQEDLSVRTRTTLSGADTVQPISGGAAVTDYENGTVTILDADLSVVRQEKITLPEGMVLLSTDGSRRFSVDYYSGISVSGASGEGEPLLPARLSYVTAMTDSVLSICYVGMEDLVLRWTELDLTAGTLTEPDVSRQMALELGLKPVYGGGYVYRYERGMKLYDEMGHFLSVCKLPEGEQSCVGSDLVWSENWQGWFFIDHYEGVSRLMFWDPAVKISGKDVELTPQEVPEGALVDQALYDRAAELSARFGLDIRIADRCVRDYNSYDSQVLTDSAVISEALDKLEEALLCYPQGFLQQLPYSDARTVRIEIVDALKAKSGADVSSGTTAFSQKRSGYYLVVINGERLREDAVFHELSHIIDKRLAWEARLRPDALFSEEGWMALNPEGFAYADSYRNIPDSVSAYADSGFFVREYACVSASEDRAMTLEKAMVGERAVFEANPGLISKLEYYCACIRDSFDTEGWPQVTPWEQILN